MGKTVLLVITLDTKGPEALYLRGVLERLGVHPLVMDVGVFPSPRGEGDIPRRQVALAGGRTVEQLVEGNDKGEAIGTMMRGAAALARSLHEQGRIHGVLSIGGAQGTLIGTTVMRGLPIGVPKVMLSTMASGARPFEAYVGTSDVTLIHSVVDFFGLNPILKQMLSNAAGAVAGMLRAGTVRSGRKPRVAITIYGTTTPAGMRIVSLLTALGYDVVAFHPNGVGGKAMEQMIRQGTFGGVIDLTLHELIDELAGGDHAAGPDRLEAASDRGIPQVVVPGSTDYIVTGRFAELKSAFVKRKTMSHNPEMTFVQPSDREMERVGRTVALKLNRAPGNTVVVVPLKGFSHPNHEGRAFHNPTGVRAFVRGLQGNLDPAVPVRLLPLHVNDPAFADAVVAEFEKLAKGNRPPRSEIKQTKGDRYVRGKDH
ncbi:MAG: Tm-1-like ATP-binding domain-containing protein [Deltaproteobacteria bacterium]|nr:Tm-1-like ATP-binding domain-containing protein [Deltaproteobacteria bacterium]